MALALLGRKKAMNLHFEQTSILSDPGGKGIRGSLHDGQYGFSSTPPEAIRFQRTPHSFTYGSREEIDGFLLPLFESICLIVLNSFFSRSKKPLVF
jgi:hypothetical protein